MSQTLTQSLSLQLENCQLKKVLLQQQAEIARTKFMELEQQEKALMVALKDAQEEANRNVAPPKQDELDLSALEIVE